MEEILASIRKIISEDSAEPRAASDPAAQDAAPESEVLELTQEIHEVRERPVAQPPAAPSASVNDASSQARPEGDVASGRLSGEEIFSDKNRKALTEALTDLAPPKPAEHREEAAASDSGLSVEAVFERTVRGGFHPVLQKWLDNNADEVVERMKPVVREWLDEHFPAMLEDAVRGEVARAVKARSRR